MTDLKKVWKLLFLDVVQKLSLYLLALIFMAGVVSTGILIGLASNPVLGVLYVLVVIWICFLDLRAIQAGERLFLEGEENTIQNRRKYLSEMVISLSDEHSRLTGIDDSLSRFKRQTIKRLLKEYRRQHRELQS